MTSPRGAQTHGFDQFVPLSPCCTNVPAWASNAPKRMWPAGATMPPPLERPQPHGDASSAYSSRPARPLVGLPADHASWSLRFRGNQGVCSGLRTRSCQPTTAAI